MFMRRREQRRQDPLRRAHSRIPISAAPLPISTVSIQTPHEIARRFAHCDDRTEAANLNAVFSANVCTSSSIFRLFCG
jgi:hypothetical protein